MTANFLTLPFDGCPFSQDVFSGFVVKLLCGTAPVDPCRPQNRGSHDYLRTHKGSRRMSRPLIQDSSVSVLFPRYKGNLT